MKRGKRQFLSGIRKRWILGCSVLVLCMVVLSACGKGADTEEFPQANMMLEYGPIMETEYGYYYNKPGDTLGMELHFFDKKTGKDIILCNKPECPHDGNPFCAATGGGLLAYSALYQDHIYTVRLQGKDDIFSMKLYRTALDGTELSEVATICEKKGIVSWTYDTFHSCAFYEGRAFLKYRYPDSDGWDIVGLAVVDLRTGSVKHLPEYSAEEQKSYGKLIPYGEWLYYYHADGYGNHPGKLIRYHIKTGETQEMEIKGNWRDYCIVDGRPVFLRYDEGTKGSLYVLDPDTMEESRLTDVILDPQGESPFPHKDYDGFLLYDGEHILVARNDKMFSGEEIFVYSKTGERLCAFPVPEYEKTGETMEDYRNQREVHIVNGKVYLTNLYDVLSCPMEDVLAGNVHWELAYRMQGEEESETESEE